MRPLFAALSVAAACTFDAGGSAEPASAPDGGAPSPGADAAAPGSPADAGLSGTAARRRDRGTDVGAPRHGSHERGRDVDVALYGTDGLATVRHYCEYATASASECLPGTATGFDGRANALALGHWLASSRVTASYLDQELIGLVQDGADAAAADGALAADLLPLFSDGVHLQHAPYHGYRVHVRVSEAAY